MMSGNLVMPKFSFAIKGLEEVVIEAMDDQEIISLH